MTVQDKKEWVMTASAVVMLAWAATLTTVGFAIAPPGEIHDSVLWVLGQAFLYAGGIFGIKEASRISARKEVNRMMADLRAHGPQHVDMAPDESETEKEDEA